jgi:hypothetical protein
MVCAGQIDLGAAQEDAAYRKYFEARYRLTC